MKSTPERVEALRYLTAHMGMDGGRHRIYREMLSECEQELPKPKSELDLAREAASKFWKLQGMSENIRADGIAIYERLIRAVISEGK